MKSFSLCAALAAFLSLPAGLLAVGEIESARNGPWSAPATWAGGQVPGEGARVLVRAGHRVVYDVQSDAVIRGITVAGTYPNFTLAITTKTGITGTAVVTVKVSDGTNFTTKSFKVTVNPPPSFVWTTLNNTIWGAGVTYDKTNGDIIALKYFSGEAYRITPQGVATLLKGGFTPAGIAMDASKNLYVTQVNGGLLKVPYNSGTNTYGTATTLVAGIKGGDVLISPDDTTLYVGDTLNFKIVKVDTTTGAVTTLAGSGTAGYTDGQGAAAQRGQRHAGRYGDDEFSVDSSF